MPFSLGGGKMTWLDGNRKLLLMVVLCIMGGIGLIAGSVTWEQFMTFCKWLFGIYAAGNGVEHVAKAVTKNGSTP